MQREEIRFVQARYHQLNLNAEQAEKVLQFENMKDSQSQTHFFSAWEEFDFEYSVFQSLLNEDQMVQYQQRVGEIREMHIERLIEQDNSNEIWSNQMREQVDYVKNELIPSILSDIPRRATLSLGRDPSKIQYLKANYETFLHDRRKQILVDHFRHNKTYAPIQLQSAMLGHYASCLLPNYAAFESWADEPTRAVLGFVRGTLSRRNSEVTEFYLGKLSESKAFFQQIKEKYNRHFDGWHTWAPDPIPEEDENRNWLMSMLLLDRNAYGFEYPG
ncbi:hypothetical protein SAMN04487996_11344 [Dyadobacter soli]|uniref:Uncharacterized protein n=2 Tax=Dyadobacter soli TaxID=659014 RepID=A0A1G7PL34_9BACT|nr:hypothetical protein SAMN04487996_11344 [Dyadobacter soli]